MPTCCARSCKNRYENGKKLFFLPRGKENAVRRELWLQRILRTDLNSASSRLCEDHFSANQFEPILLRKFGTKKLKRDATPTIFSQEHLRTSECNDTPFPSSGFELLLAAAAAADVHKDTCCPSSGLDLPLTPAAVVDASGSNSDGTQSGLSSSQGQPGTDTAPSYCSEETLSSSECNILVACSPDVETSQGSYCQAFPALTVPDESQQKVCAYCGGVQSAEGTANVTGNSTRSGDADPSVVAALQKRIATLEDCLKNMKRKVKTLQQQKSRANNRNNELSQNIRKYLSPDQLLGMETSSTRGTPWSTETIQKGLKLRLACGSRGYNTIRELAVPIPSERTLQRRVQNYKFSPGILHKVLQSLALKVK
ncbi:uncharacterized protein LOC125947050 [Dermacentor silvarum]|uniref:uncharacterized protein LOC125947050 n=1 Tax=Dermacentor silvarum TaxID=543639 RepID=UPI002101BF0B|nr:uncharacterized protein LOC125947050 [Dermacentor silvarum]